MVWEGDERAKDKNGMVIGITVKDGEVKHQVVLVVQNMERSMKCREMKHCLRNLERTEKLRKKVARHGRGLGMQDGYDLGGVVAPHARGVFLQAY